MDFKMFTVLVSIATSVLCVIALWKNQRAMRFQQRYIAYLEEDRVRRGLVGTGEPPPMRAFNALYNPKGEA